MSWGDRTRHCLNSVTAYTYGNKTLVWRALLVYTGGVNTPIMRQTAVLVIRNVRSRTECSVLLRHDGLRVLEANSVDELVVLATEQPVDLVLADLEVSERSVFHRELLARLPGVTCLFVAERMSPEALAKEVRMLMRGVGSEGAAPN